MGKTGVLLGKIGTLGEYKDTRVLEGYLGNIGILGYSRYTGVIQGY